MPQKDISQESPENERWQQYLDPSGNHLPAYLGFLSPRHKSEKEPGNKKKRWDGEGMKFAGDHQQIIRKGAKLIVIGHRNRPIPVGPKEHGA